MPSCLNSVLVVLGTMSLIDFKIPNAFTSNQKPNMLGLVRFMYIQEMTTLTVYYYM